MDCWCVCSRAGVIGVFGLRVRAYRTFADAERDWKGARFTLGRAEGAQDYFLQRWRVKDKNNREKKRARVVQELSPIGDRKLSLLYLVRTPCVRAVAVGTPLKNVRSCVRAPRDNQVGRDSTRKAKGLSTIYFLKKEKILPSHPESLYSNGDASWTTYCFYWHGCAGVINI